MAGSIPESIGGMASLRVLRLNHNKLTGARKPSHSKASVVGLWSLLH